MNDTSAVEAAPKNTTRNTPASYNPEMMSTPETGCALDFMYAFICSLFFMFNRGATTMATTTLPKNYNSQLPIDICHYRQHGRLHCPSDSPAVCQ